MHIKATLHLTRETKGAYRYEEPETNPSGHKLQLYLRKDSLAGEKPQALTLEVKDLDVEAL